MSSKTYLQAVNDVILRLRETEVSTVNQTAYSKLIGAFVNDARDYVEGRYNWIGLEEIINVTTSDGTAEYTLDGAGDQAGITDIVDDTNKRTLIFKENDWLQKQTQISPLSNDEPIYYSISGQASDGDPLLTLRPTPAGAYTLKVYTDKTGVPLTGDTDTIPVPPTLVVQLALALARGERGETGGATDLNTFPLADIWIQNAIIIESAKRPEDLTWVVDGDRPHNTNWNQ